MAVALLSSTASAGTGTASTTCVATFTATTAGSVVVLIIGSTAASVSSISGGGGTWSQAGNSNNSHNFAKIWIGIGCSAGTTTATVTFGASTNSGVQEEEFSGVDTSSPIDTTAKADGVSTAASTGAATPTTADNVLIAAVVGGTTISAGPSGGLTGLTPLTFSSPRQVAGGYLIQTAASPVTAGWTLGSSGNWDIVEVFLKGATGAATGTAASSFGWTDDASGAAGASGTSDVAFGWVDDASGAAGASSGSSVAFGWSTAATGLMTIAAVTGTSDASFGWSTAGIGFQNIASQASVYGPAFNIDTKNNGRVGPDMSALSYRFRAPTSSATVGVVWQRRFGGVGAGNYSGGNGGTMRIGIQADDGTSNHFPSGTYLGSTDYTPGSQPTGNKGIYTTLPSISLTANTLYHLVFTNVDGSPSTNFFSVNNVYIFGSALTPRQPAFADVDLAVLYRSGSWSTQPKDTPDFDLVMADGRHIGSRYMASNHDPGTFGTINGASSMVRERFTVTGGPLTVSRAWYRLSKSGGTSGLVTFRLEDSSGTLIEQGTVAGAGVVAWSSGSDSQTGSWISYTFTTPRVLVNGLEYRLRISTDAASTYYSVIMLTQDSNDDPAHHMLSRGFTDGVTEKTTNGGGAWSAVYSGFPNNGQWYFDVTTGPGPGNITGFAASAFGFSSALTGTSTVLFTGTSAVTFGWSDSQPSPMIGMAGASGTAASTFGWSDAAQGANGGVSGSGGVTFGWSDTAIGGTTTATINGAAASSFGWSETARGRKRRPPVDHRVRDMLFPPPHGVWNQPKDET